jgi:peptidoglycan/LPS O-acetylase OafA/YrhL
MLQTGWLTTDLSYNAPAWMLSIELAMYFIFFAVLFHSGHTKKYIIYFLLLIYAGLVIRLSGWEIPFFNPHISRGLTAFFTGCITANIHEFSAKHIKFEKCFIPFLYVIVFMSIFLPVCSTFSSRLDIFTKGWWDLCYIFVFFPALLLLILKVNFLSKLFSIKPLLYLGELSFAIYMLHYPLQLLVITAEQHFIFLLNWQAKKAWLVFTAIVILISHLTHYYFEKPVQKFIRSRLSNRGCQRSAEIPSG